MMLGLRREPLGSKEGIEGFKAKIPQIEFHEALRVRYPKFNYCPFCGAQLWSAVHPHNCGDATQN